MRFGIAVVAGLSMVPTLAPGERLLIKYGGPYVLGDLVVVKHAGQFDVKRIEQIKTEGLFVVGDNSLVSTDSRSYGLIPHENAVGTIVMRVWPQPGRITAS